MHEQVGNLTPGLLKDSFGNFGFLAIRVLGQFGTNRFPALAVDFRLTFDTGDSKDSNSNRFANVSFENL